MAGARRQAGICEDVCMNAIIIFEECCMGVSNDGEKIYPQIEIKCSHMHRLLLKQPTLCTIYNKVWNEHVLKLM